MSPPLTTCNGCGRTANTSKEHLIHQGIGAVIVRDRGVRTEDLRRLLVGDEYLGGYLRHTSDGSEPILFDNYITDLVCKDCNNRWANQLEQQAGDELYAFVHEGGSVVDAGQLRRWVWFFAIKLWFYEAPTDALAGGPLRPVLHALAQPDGKVMLYTRVARLDADPEIWRFGWAFKTTGPDVRFEFVLWGIWFFALVQETGPPNLPFRTVKLTGGATRNSLPVIPRRELAVLPEVAVSL
ncbi:MAG: hypothetical protein WD276_09390 [Actinomycetota bacterium]